MLKEIGQYKDSLQSIFVNNDNICKLLLGNDYEDKDYDLNDELNKYIIPHLYIPNTITSTSSYIMYDVEVSNTSRTVKEMKITIECICHKDIIKYNDKPTGYYGFRYDTLSQMIEESLCPQDDRLIKEITKKFGIGNFELRSVKLFLANKYIGRVLTFITPDFR